MLKVLGAFWNYFFFSPIINLLVYFSAYFGGIAWGVVILVVFIKILTLPITIKRIKYTRIAAKLRPEIAKLRKRFKNKEKFERAKKKLYEKYGYHPTRGFIPLLVMFPVLIALYQSVRKLTVGLDHIDVLYPFVSALLKQKGVASINNSLWGINLLSKPTLGFLIVLFGITYINYFVNYLVFGKARLASGNIAKTLAEQAPNMKLDESAMQRTFKIMNYTSFLINSLFFVYIMRVFPAILSFYIAAQYILNVLVLGAIYFVDKYINPRILGDPHKRGE